MIGFIGLGIMGKPMVLNLLKAGIKLLVNDSSSLAEEEIRQHGGQTGSYVEIGEQCELIFTMLPTGAIVQEVLFGKDGVVNQMSAGTIICDLSSVTPRESVTCYEQVRERAGYFLDAPVSGGESGAETGTLAFMVGGDEEAFIKLEPYFKIMGKTAVWMGKSGSGSVTKLTNQIIVNNTIAVVSEAFTLAVKSGVEPEKVYQAIKGGLAGSAVLDAKLPQILKRDFKPGGKVSINHKDIKNVLDTAHEIDVVLPYTSLLFEIMQTLKVHGMMDQDHGAIVKYFEQLSNIQIGGE